MIKNCSNNGALLDCRFENPIGTVLFALKRCKQTYYNSSVHGNSVELITSTVSYSSPWHLVKTKPRNKSSPKYLLNYAFPIE